MCVMVYYLENRKDVGADGVVSSSCGLKFFESALQEFLHFVDSLKDIFNFLLDSSRLVH